MKRDVRRSGAISRTIAVCHRVAGGCVVRPSRRRSRVRLIAAGPPGTTSLGQFLFSRPVAELEDRDCSLSRPTRMLARVPEPLCCFSVGPLRRQGLSQPISIGVLQTVCFHACLYPGRNSWASILPQVHKLVACPTSVGARTTIPPDARRRSNWRTKPKTVSAATPAALFARFRVSRAG